MDGRRVSKHWILAVLLVVGLASALGCDSGGHDHDHDHDHPHSHGHDDDHDHAKSDADGDHGKKANLGSLELGGKSFLITSFGEVSPGVESGFDVSGVDMTGDEVAALSLFLWVESENGAQLSAPAKGMREGDKLHFHVTPQEGQGAPKRVVLRLRNGDEDVRGSLNLAD